MAVSNFILRNIAPQVMTRLKKEAIKQKVSVNSLILHILERGVGVIQPIKKTVFHDLDHLAGTWNKNDKKTFDENIKSFGDVDKELWS